MPSRGSAMAAEIVGYVIRWREPDGTLTNYYGPFLPDGERWVPKSKADVLDRRTAHRIVREWRKALSYCWQGKQGAIVVRRIRGQSEKPISLDELVAMDAAYRAKVAACEHSFTERALGASNAGLRCPRCGVHELPWLRGERAQLRAALETVRPTIQYLREYVKDRALSAEDDADEALETIDAALGSRAPQASSGEGCR